MKRVASLAIGQGEDGLGQAGTCQAKLWIVPVAMVVPT